MGRVEVVLARPRSPDHPVLVEVQRRVIGLVEGGSAAAKVMVPEIAATAKTKEH